MRDPLGATDRQTDANVTPPFFLYAFLTARLHYRRDLPAVTLQLVNTRCAVCCGNMSGFKDYAATGVKICVGGWAAG
jgi:hypothetical protein